MRLAAIGLIAGIMLGSSLTLVWAWESRHTHVVLLASGHALSTMITTPSSRLVMASGDDPEAFLESLDAFRRPTEKVVDVLLVWGEADDLAVAETAAQVLHPEHVFGLTPFARSDDQPSLRGVGVLPEVASITLDAQTVITIHRWPVGNQDDGRTAWAWEALVEASGATVRITSGHSPIQEPTDEGVLVVAGTHSERVWGDQTVVVFADDTLSGRKARAAAQNGAHPERVARVFPGDPVVLTLSDGQIVIADGVTQPLELDGTP